MIIMSDATPTATDAKANAKPGKITAEFLQNLGQHYPNVDMTVWGPVLAAQWAQYEPALTAAKATKDENVTDLATAQWIKSGDATTADYAKAVANVEALQAKLDEWQTKADGIRDAAIAPYVEQAKAYVSENGSTVKDNLRKAATNLTNILKAALGSDLPSDFPKISGKAGSVNAGGTGARESGGWRPKLSRVTVNGESVAFTGDRPTMADIAAAVGSQGSVTSFSKTMLNLNNGNREVAPSGSGKINLTVNGNAFEVIMFGVDEDEAPNTK